MFEEKGIFVFNKDQYTEMVETKKFGGSPRSIAIVSFGQMGNIAMVKVFLESEYLKFESRIICVHENGKWQVIGNIPKMEKK